MTPIFGVWSPVQRKLLRRVRDRLANTGGCLDVRYEASRRDPNEVAARIDPSAFLGRVYATDEARLRVEFEFDGDRSHYWIQWWEPAADRSIGWHCDETEPEYGPLHVQIEYPDGTTERKPGNYVEDEHPYRSFERHFAAIDETLTRIGWE